MAEEYLDVVDEEDRVTRRATFEEVIERKLRRRTVNVLLSKDLNLEEIAIAKRSANQKSSPGKWHVTAGGHVVSGESYEAAAYRETIEELFGGVPPTRPLGLRIVARFQNDAPEKGKFENSALVTGVYDGIFTPDPKEIETIEWRRTIDVMEDVDRNPGIYTKTMGIVIPLLRIYMNERL